MNTNLVALDVMGRDQLLDELVKLEAHRVVTAEMVRAKYERLTDVILRAAVQAHYAKLERRRGESTKKAA